MVPIVVGWVLSGGLVSAQAADDTRAKIALTVVVALMTWRTAWNPMWLLAAGSVLGAAHL
jgi:chromate transporter